MPPQITVIGSANVDFIMQVEKLPALGETVTNGHFFQAFGGKGANQAVAAARAGGHVRFVGALGHDPLAQSFHQSLTNEGIDLTHTTREDDVPGGSALVMFDAQGDNYLTVAPGANARITPARVEAAEGLIATSAWVILQQEIPRESNERALQIAARHHVPVLLNYAPASDLRLVPDSAVHALVVNEGEAAALLGEKESSGLEASAKQAMALRQRGAHRFVVITLGELGSVVAHAEGTFALPAFHVKPVDTTAAGDTFCGTLAVALSEGQSLVDAVRFASAASALAVTKVGAQSSIPQRRETQAFLDQQPAR